MSTQLEKQLRIYPSDYLTYTELCSLLPGSDNARYAQIKRALKEGLLIRLKKGIYYRGQFLAKEKPHPFEMAQQILWPSYVSLGSALSYHGLIPEAVYQTTSVTIKRPTAIQNEFGVFSYLRLPRENFFIEVLRETINQRAFLVASPWKAIMDYIFCYKKNWQDISPLIESLRIDINLLPSLEEECAEKLSQFYSSKRVDRFLKNIGRYQ